MQIGVRSFLSLLILIAFTPLALAEAPVSGIHAAVDAAVAKVKPALVRIHVVSTNYRDGRAIKQQSSGSGVVITPEGHVITNHHVAGHATRLVCTLSNREEVDAVLVGKDPLTDLAVIKLTPANPQTFPTVEFGDSDAARVGDHVLAMGSPLALSQSVTLGIISNAEMVMPKWYGPFGAVRMDGEDVGSLVRWIAHDAQIFGGNSGGPLIDLNGDIIGINEISMGLGGAIPGNLAKDIANELIATGEIRRSWLGISIQPRLKQSSEERGVLIRSAMAGSPAAKAGFKAGDMLVELAGQPINVRFQEEVPAFNRLALGLSIGEPVKAVVLREGKEVSLMVTPEFREQMIPDEHEMKQWGLTCRDLSYVISKEMKRDNTDGILVTSVRPGGPVGDAKPSISNDDVITHINGQAVDTVEAFREVTSVLTKDITDPITVLVTFDRKSDTYITVVSVGIEETPDPALNVKKAWLPISTQVISRDIARMFGDPELTGFRVTQVYKGSTAETAGLQVGDLILSVDSVKLTASAPEDFEELPALIREYRAGTKVELQVRRDSEVRSLPIELVLSPKEVREMKKYTNEDFEFSVREIGYADRTLEKWDDDKSGVLVEDIRSGGWADLGQLYVGDLIMAVNGTSIGSPDELKDLMKEIQNTKPDYVVIKVLRGIHTAFVELEPKWEY